MTPLAQLEHSIVEDCGDAIVAKTMLGTIVSWNAAAERLFGYAAKEVLGRSIDILVPNELADEEANILLRLEGGEHTIGLLTYRLHKDGQRMAVTLTISPLCDAAGNIIGTCTIARSSSEPVADTAHLVAQAFQDSLTGLANRTALADRLTHSMRRHERSGLYGGLLFIDLDDFKSINDRFGHVVGDQLLKACADRLNKVCRKVDTISRWGGDEFVVLVEDLAREGGEAALRLQRVGDKLLDTLRPPYELSTGVLPCTASIGGCLFQGRGITSEQLIDAADNAMYSIKRIGKNGIHIVGSQPI